MLDYLTAKKMALEIRIDLAKRREHSFAGSRLDLCIRKKRTGECIKKFPPSHIIEHIKHYSLFELLWQQCCSKQRCAYNVSWQMSAVKWEYLSANTSVRYYIFSLWKHSGKSKNEEEIFFKVYWDWRGNSSGYSALHMHLEHQYMKIKTYYCSPLSWTLDFDLEHKMICHIIGFKFSY